MNYTIKDELLRHRYDKLSTEQQAQVDQMIKRHLIACGKLGVAPEIEATFKEAVDMVVKGKWEPDRPIERQDLIWRYDVYTPPQKEAA